MNKHIALVKKWLADPKSVTLEELEANRKSALAAGIVSATWAATYAAAAAEYWAEDDAAYWAEYWATEAAYWVKRYEELVK